MLFADERRLAREAANCKANAERAELKARLEAEHGLEAHHKRDLLWRKAWDLGHSAGLSEVENYYSDLAELLS